MVREIRDMRYFLSICFIIISAAVQAATASDPYEQCIKSFDFGDDTNEVIVVTPLNSDCASACDSDCASFSRKNNGVELNDQAIATCTSACRSGVQVAIYYYEVDGSSIVVRGPGTNALMCSGLITPTNNATKSQIGFNTGDEIMISLISSGVENKIYMCGVDYVTLDPMFRSTSIDEWSDTTKPPQGVLKDTSICSYSMSADDWDLESNASLGGQVGTGICQWNARNNQFTDTGIYAQDGDELSITYQSSYVYAPSGVPGSDPNRFTKLSIYQLLNSDTTSSSTKKTLDSILQIQSYLQIMQPFSDPSDSRAGFWTLVGEDARVTAIGQTPTTSLDTATSYKWKGLTGTVQDEGVVTSSITNTSSCDTEEKRAANPSLCTLVLDPGQTLYIFSGVLSDFSAKPALLGFRHYDAYDGFGDNIGGTQIWLRRGGCVHKDGDLLQYNIAESTPSKDDTNWQDVTEEMLNGSQTITVSGSSVSEGLHIFFRIKPVTPSETLPDFIQEKYNNPAYHFGQYYVSVSKVSTPSFKKEGGPIKEIVDIVMQTMLGSDSSAGVVEKLFTALVKNSVLISMIRALLVFYVAVTALGYLIGIVKLSQQDIIYRLVKMGIIVALISPNSWEFFSKNFFNVFINGGLQLIAYVVVGSLGNTLSLAQVQQDPTLVFSILDGPFNVLCSKALWAKISAILFTSGIGFATCIGAIAAVVFYFLAIAKTLMMFLMSIIITSILIFTAPFFLCCMLFSLTRNFFNTWWKYLLSFTLQPVVLFCSIAIFNLLINVIMRQALGFSVCPQCALSILNKCVITWYYTLSQAHFPLNSVGFLVPNGMLEGTLIMLLLTYNMYHMCGFIAYVTNMIVSGQMVNVSSLATYGDEGFEIAKSFVAMDNYSRRRRRGGG